LTPLSLKRPHSRLSASMGSQIGRFARGINAEKAPQPPPKNNNAIATTTGCYNKHGIYKHMIFDRFSFSTTQMSIPLQATQNCRSATSFWRSELEPCPKSTPLPSFEVPDRFSGLNCIPSSKTSSINTYTTALVYFIKRSSAQFHFPSGTNPSISISSLCLR